MIDLRTLSTGLMGILAVAMPMSPWVTNDARAQAVELSEGVIIDGARAKVYLMSPDKSVRAFSAVTGNQLWESTDAAKPLSLSGNLLVCQAEAVPSTSELDLVVLNTDQEGGRVTTAKSPLPAGIAPQIDDTFSSQFSVRAENVNEEAFVTWQKRDLVVRGMDWEDDEGELAEVPFGAEAAPPGGASVSSGTIKLNLQSGEAAAVDPAAVPEAFTETMRMARTAAPGEPVNPNHRLSADGRHLLKSERVADDREFQKYQLTIIDIGMDQELGRVRSHLSQTAFVVVGGQVILVTGPYSQRVDGNFDEQPAKVRAIDLASGKEVWSQPVRDTMFRGAYPP